MIDVFIINKNLYTAPKAMVDKLVTLQGVGRIIIVDNSSESYQVKQWYKSDKRFTVEQIDNIGHKCVWQLNLPAKYKCSRYVVTDSDLDISNIPSDTLLHLSKLIDKYNLPKVGLSIQIDDIPTNSIYNQIDTPKCGLETERQFLSYPINADVVFAPVDTTFALYHEKQKGYSVGGARAKYPYSCRHLPFYYTFETLKADGEYMFYIKHANNSSSLKFFLSKYQMI